MLKWDVDTWKDVTILFTLSQFPVDLALAPKLGQAFLIASMQDTNRSRTGPSMQRRYKSHMESAYLYRD